MRKLDTISLCCPNTWLVATPYEALYAHAQRIADHLSCDAVIHRHELSWPGGSAGVLWLLPDGLSVSLSSELLGCQSMLKVDFLTDDLRYRLKHKAKKELLIKAVGVRRGSPLSVLDATAGLGRDAFVLASLGCRVHVVERSTVMGALLKDALTRARSCGTAAAWRMHFITADARDVLQSLAPQQRPDVIYLDPMYPPRDSSALVRQSMRCLRAIVGDDVDSRMVLQEALWVAKQRVVIKRPRHSKSLGEREPDVILKGRSSRFDVYWAWKDKQGRS